MTILAGLVLALVQAAPASASAILLVPQDFPTIQAAVDAAAPGDTVLVGPGTYQELVDFRGKTITVESTNGPAVTVIDGNAAGPVVRINGNPGETPVLRGFTIRNGGGTAGSGVVTTGGPVLIEGNRVVGNTSCSGGIEARFSAATIRNNVIADNVPLCSGGGGGGVAVGGAGTVQVLNNVITGNRSGGAGGGIDLFAAGTPTISGNVISGNSAGAFSEGGGISIFNASDALITNNVIVGNTAGQGGGISWLVPSGDRGPAVTNNTIADNSGAAVLADGFDAATRLTNNVIVGSDPQVPAIFCGDFNDPNPPVFAYNDVVNSGSGPLYGGICTDQTGSTGNISADPLFVDSAAGDYHLRAGSPAIDVGLDAAAPASDIDGDPRPLDGDGDGIAVVDLGADERGVRDGTPPAITCVATPRTLTPPNQTLRRVQVRISASDDSGSVAVGLVSVTSSQRDSGLGPRDVPGDIQGWTTGTDDRTGLLRAERFGAARVYTLTYQAADPAGNTTRCRAAVTVPLR